MKVSLIIPCYNEESALPAFYQAACETFAQLDGYEAEFLFIDDGSTDKTLFLLKAYAERDERVK